MYKSSLYALIIIAMISCNNDEGNTVPGEPAPMMTNLTINVQHKVDNSSLYIDSILYTNAAGNNYSIIKLMYYLSNFKLYQADSLVYSSDKVYFIDAFSSSGCNIVLTDIPEGTYNKIECNIGVDSIMNCSGGLATTQQNINMAWPVQLGGGYHFLKLEGYFMDNGNTTGFAMHMGMNACLINATINKPFLINHGNNSMQLTMNINEWFTHPSNYDFNVDGNYSMASTPAMIKLSQNGADVFY